jgi:hypothetical protein
LGGTPGRGRRPLDRGSGLPGSGGYSMPIMAAQRSSSEAFVLNESNEVRPAEINEGRQWQRSALHAVVMINRESDLPADDRDDGLDGSSVTQPILAVVTTVVLYFGKDISLPGAVTQHGAADLHRGTSWSSARPGNSQFTVRLPILRPRSERTPRKGPNTIAQARTDVSCWSKIMSM